MGRLMGPILHTSGPAKFKNYFERQLQKMLRANWLIAYIIHKSLHIIAVYLGNSTGITRARAGATTTGGGGSSCKAFVLLSLPPALSAHRCRWAARGRCSYRDRASTMFCHCVLICYKLFESYKHTACLLLRCTLLCYVFYGFPISRILEACDRRVDGDATLNVGSIIN